MLVKLEKVEISVMREYWTTERKRIQVSLEAQAQWNLSLTSPTSSGKVYSGTRIGNTSSL